MLGDPPRMDGYEDFSLSSWPRPSRPQKLCPTDERLFFIPPRRLDWTRTKLKNGVAEDCRGNKVSRKFMFRFLVVLFFRVDIGAGD